MRKAELVASPLSLSLTQMAGLLRHIDEDFVQGLRAKADSDAIQATIDETKLRVEALGKATTLDRNDRAQYDRNTATLNAAASAAGQIIGTSKTFQAAAGPLVALSRKSVVDRGVSLEPGSDLEELLNTLGATAGKLKVLVIDEMSRAKVSDVFGAAPPTFVSPHTL